MKTLYFFWSAILRKKSRSSVSLMQLLLSRSLEHNAPIFVAISVTYCQQTLTLKRKYQKYEYFVTAPQYFVYNCKGRTKIRDLK
jgi:hypothetical protein